MYRRDYFLNETQRLAQMMARLLGLKDKTEGREQLQPVYNNAMNDEFNISDEELQKLNLDEFKLWLAQQDFSPVKLDALAQLLHLRAEPFERNPETLLLLQKVIVLYDKLEQEHHQQSFENIGKRATIQQYIQNYDA